MNERIEFTYFYGNEADAYSFYRVPKLLFSDYFKALSSDAKLLYGLMLDRMGLSVKNQWFDEENRAYIYFSIEEIMDMMNCGHNKAVKSMQELEQIGLIEKKRQGFGKANVIYVKNFAAGAAHMKSKSAETEAHITEFPKTEDCENTEFLKSEDCSAQYSEKGNSRVPKKGIQEFRKSEGNNTEYNNTYKSDTESNLIVSVDTPIRSDGDEMAKASAYREIIKENVDYDSLVITHALDRELIDGIIDLMLETVLCRNDQILIASNRYPTQIVKSKFLKLNYSHIEYVLDCFTANTTKVKNIKKYLLAALFNAPTTIDGYYRAEVNHDMYGA